MQWLIRGGCILLAALGASCAGSSRSAQPKPAGDGALSASAHVPAAVTPSVVKGVAGGGFAGYAVLADGHVWAWGDDLEGQIGSAGAWQGRSVPVPVRGLVDVVAVTGGQNTAYALARGGGVWAWGDDSQGELGDSGFAPRQTPIRVRVPSGVVALAAGTFSAFALRRDGTVWAWGGNSWGQLGTGDAQAARASPRRVRQLASIVAIAAGAGDGYALRRDGTVWAWGDDSLGQLGAGGCGRSSCRASGVPVRTQGLSDVTAITAGADTAYALRRDGTVWAWGDGSFGALGRRVGSLSVNHPVRVSGLAHVVAITAGSYSAYAVAANGTAWAWGRGVEGEIGDGSTADRTVPTRVPRLTDAVEIAAGGDSVYAIDRRGRLWAWGNGVYGQLGDGYRVSLDEPTTVLGLRAEPSARHRN
jgi:alpha-tubulin suppressor-like RCC1 family protein